jgi:starvation-inducible DNA-binding protein
MATSSGKTFAQLGYSHLDTAEIVTLLNRLLSNYAVYQQKLRNFYWNVAGPDFFEMHDQFGSMYERAQQETDRIAKRIRLFGQNPFSTFTEYLKHATIIEEPSGVPSFEMANIILADIRTLLELMEAAVNAAGEISDNGTGYMLQSFIYRMEEDHWKLTAWIKQGV